MHKNFNMMKRYAIPLVKTFGSAALSNVRMNLLDSHTRMLFSIVAVAMMILAPSSMKAGDHNGNTVSYSVNGHGNGNPWLSDALINSSGDEVRVIGDNYYERQIAITGSFNGGDWAYRSDRPDIRPSAHTQTLSIMNLFQGDKVILHYWGDGASATMKSNNTNVSVGSNVSGNGSTQVTMNSNGSMDFSINTKTFITKIQVIYNNTSNRIAFSTAGQQSGGYYLCRLSARTFNEPTLSVYPSNANVTYTVETYDKMNGTKLNDVYHEVAMMNNQQYKKGDLLFKNLGWCKVTATANGQSASYWVECWDNEAHGELQSDGITYKVVKIKDENGNLLPDDQQGGVLKERTVTAVPGITMKFGIPNDNTEPNTTVAYLRDGHMVSYTSANNGWWDRFPHNNHDWPEQGTFYRFEATAKGKLRFGGIKDLSGGKTGKVYLVRISTGYPQEEVFTLNESGYLTTDGSTNNNVKNGIEMEPGYVYYLQGEANEENGADNWSVFLLEWFSYETDMKISGEWGVSAQTGYEIGNGGTVTSKETVTGASGATCTVTCKGKIQSATASIDGNGHIVFSNIQFSESGEDKMGGAMKVDIAVGTSHLTYYMTIPYGKHVWDFRRTSDQGPEQCDWSYNEEGLVNMMNANGTDWTRVYKVHRRENGKWTELISPIMAARGAVEGNNAFYMDNTSGLTFVTSQPASFGAGETKNNADGFANMTQDEQYYLNYSTTSGADLVWLQGRSTVYFPGVKAGQYIKVYLYRHSDNKGETFTVNNLMDLDGVPYDGTTNIKIRGMWDERWCGYQGKNMKGATIFRVPLDYTATNEIDKIPCLTLTDDGWTKLYKIEITDEYKTDLIMTDDNGYFPVDYDGEYSSVVIRDKNGVKTPVVRTYLATTGQTRCQHANTCDYEIIPDAGVNVTVDRKIWNSSTKLDYDSDPNIGRGVNYNHLKLTFNGGNGLVRIIQRERANPSGTGVSTAVPSASLGYVVSKNEYYIAVGELTEQSYPYTWDFTQHNMYQGSSTTKTDLATQPSTIGYGYWTGDEGNENSFGQNAFVPQGFCKNDGEVKSLNATVYKQLFAQGAELSSVNGVISETVGLGISRPYADDKVYESITSKAEDGTTLPNNQVRVALSYYKGYDLENGGISLDGDMLQGAGTITIPSVDKDMYVFVKSSAEPAVSDNVGTAEKYNGHVNDFDLEANVYVYKVNTAGDVVLKFSSNASVEKIGVTNQFKQIVNTAGKTTESRDIHIDYAQTEAFVNSKLHAYIATDYEATADEGETGNLVLKEIGVAPASTGLVLFTENTSGNVSNPLFVPACNNPEEATTGNHLVANVTQSTVAASTEDVFRYVFTNQFKYKIGDGTYKTGEYGFYKVNTPGTLKGNMAYLELNQETNAKSIVLLSFFNATDTPTAIDEVVTMNGVTEFEDVPVYYNLNGVRMNNIPMQKGIYIRNGKKVYVK